VADGKENDVTQSDRELGMHRPITRREFLTGRASPAAARWSGRRQSTRKSSRNRPRFEW